MSASPADEIRVLYAEDQADFAGMATIFLEREDERLSIEKVSSADEGLSRLEREEFDCVVSDYDMPGRNGIEFLEAVRERYADLPFLLFTGKGDEEVASDAISAGVTDYHQKESGTEQYTVLANRIANAVERARAEQARRRHLEAIETAQEGISILDTESRFVYVNQAYADLYGYEPEEMLGEHWAILYLDEDIDEIHEEIEEHVTNEGVWRGETTGLRADGTTFVEDHRLAETETGEVVCTVLDASEEKEHERAIEELHSTARSFIRAETAAEIADVAVDAVADILRMPANGVHLYDDGEGALVPVAWTDRTETLIGEPPVFGPGDGYVWDAFETGEPRRYGLVSADSDQDDGSETTVRSGVALPLDGHGVLLIGSSERGAFDDTDVSLAQTVAAHATTALDRVDREQELARQNERLETFTGVVSHDLRNPLAVASGQLKLAQSECDSESLDAVERALDRTTMLLDDLRAFARVGAETIEPETLELASLCESCWQHVETGDATLVTDTARLIRADRSRLQQLVENLVRNAVEHGSANDRTGGDGDGNDESADDDGDGVTITVGDLEDGFYVADDGPGVPVDDRERIFERGYSTNERGTGFGLAIVREIADIHGWDIGVTDGEDGGARFEITGVDVVEGE